MISFKQYLTEKWGRVGTGKYSAKVEFPHNFHRYKGYINEAYHSTMTKKTHYGMGSDSYHTEIFKNPSRKELMTDLSKYDESKGLAHENGDVYMWHPERAYHHEVREHLKDHVPRGADGSSGMHDFYLDHKRKTVTGLNTRSSATEALLTHPWFKKLGYRIT